MVTSHTMTEGRHGTDRLSLSPAPPMTKLLTLLSLSFLINKVGIITLASHSVKHPPNKCNFLPPGFFFFLINYSPEKETVFINKCHSFIQQTFNKCLLCARWVLLIPEPLDNQRWGLSLQVEYTQGHTPYIVIRHFVSEFSC